MKKDDSIYLDHIMDAVNQITRYTTGLAQEEFLENRLVQDAVVRQFTILGEAAKKVSPEYKQRFPGIEWKSLAGFRDVLVHDYDGIDLWEVWRIVRHDLPTLRQKIEKAIGSL